MISGAITAVLLVAFGGIAGWAWSSRQRRRFAEAERLPLLDEVPSAECRVPNESRPCCATRHSTLDTRHSTLP